MKSLFLEPYSSKSPRGAAAGTKRMDLKVTSPSAVKWIWPSGSSVSCWRGKHSWNDYIKLFESTYITHTLKRQHFCPAAYLGEGLVESLVLVLLNLLGWSLPDGLDVIHQLPVPHGLLNLEQIRSDIFKNCANAT